MTKEASERRKNRRDFYHTIDARPFTRPVLDELCQLSTAIRRKARSKEGAVFLQSLLAGSRAMLYFTQPSTRTFLSFNNACQVLGMGTSEIRDSATSSEVKGESFEDSIRTFSSYVDVIIMRTPGEGLAKRAADLMNSIPRRVPIINAGSGKDQHPTQALLDIYTLNRSFEQQGGIDGKVIGMMGDLKRGRTVRSLSYLMKNYADVKLVFISSDAFKMESDIKDHLNENRISFEETANMVEALPELDALYVTRTQSEHDQANETGKAEFDRFSVLPKHLELFKKDAIIMHPLPRGPEIHPEVDKDPRAMYWRQERNGMWMRAALLLKIFGLEKEVL